VVKEIRIYVEGGGDKSDTRAAIREGFSKFLQPLCQLARKHRIRWSVTACGGRDSAFEIFRTAMETYTDAFLVLLVDSESPVAGGRWKHVHGGVGELSEDHCHLMVQTVEAWLIADPEALAEYYGKGFRRGALPRHENIEAVPKDNLYKSLQKAVAETKKERYEKIRHCADLLARLNPDRVRERAKHCDLLFQTLEARISGASQKGA
jgi:hypothetical protein